jgi:hypothetical protein
VGCKSIKVFILERYIVYIPIIISGIIFRLLLHKITRINIRKCL